MQTKKGVTILVTAYNVVEFIEECLDSIESQTYFKDFKDYEILVGVDGCEKTLEKVKSIRDKYRNLRIFMMSRNKGTYITTNTLITKGKYDTFLRFDSDDVMLPHMVENTMKLMETNHIVSNKFHKWTNGKIAKESEAAHGVITFNKDVLRVVGGYEPWICGADTDFLRRAIVKGGLIQKYVIDPTPNFLYRQHMKSLKNVYNDKDALRKKYNAEMFASSKINVLPVIWKATEIE